MDSLFELEVHDGVAVVTFDDGKVNAISPAAVDGFAETLDGLEADDQVRALVIEGRPGQFCAGYDLNTLMLGGEPRNALVTGGWDVMKRLFAWQQPVVMACSGNAVAGGAVLLLTGDVRFGAMGDFKIGFNEVSIGIPLPGMVLALAASRLASDELFAATAGARMYQPLEAIEAGFLHRVFPPETLRQAAVDEAGRLASLPADAFSTTKQSSISHTARRMQESLPADMALLARIGG